MKNSHRDPLLIQTLEIISTMPTEQVAFRSGLAASTIRNWKSGKTSRPQSISLQFALRAAGYNLAIVKDKK